MADLKSFSHTLEIMKKKSLAVFTRLCLLLVCLIGLAPILACSKLSHDNSMPAMPPSPTTVSNVFAEKPRIRFATFNVAMNRPAAGALAAEMSSGESPKTQQIAEIIQTIRPDVLLLNEFDYDETGRSIKDFQQKFLQQGQGGAAPIEYPYVFTASVNTGVDSGLDLNGDGKTGTADDAFGYGEFPGQYGMVVLSKYPIQTENIRTFQNFLWKQMPDAKWPIDPATEKSFYSDEVKSLFRLSSKSHWDVPIKVGEQTIHFLVSHPTPPVFDGEEDRNGCRNHDEIRFWADYVSGKDYFVDDAGMMGGLVANSLFVIAGDQNADPVDGDSNNNAARQLTEHPLVNADVIPSSKGGVFYAKKDGRANLKHKGDPAHDTGDFNDFTVGNLRIDYCLPSKNLTIIDAGVFWPLPDQPGGDLVSASDHRLVWVDVKP